jgi:hypothetical protein
LNRNGIQIDGKLPGDFGKYRRIAVLEKNYEI